MTQTASVNYHVHKANRQAFELDAGGVVGNLISPELAPTQVVVVDNRTATGGVDFANASVGFAHYPTHVSAFEGDGQWQADYDAELAKLLKTEIGAKEVVVFDHTIRKDDPDSKRKPARNVHSDYSEGGAKQRIIDILGEETAREWSAGHFGFVNVWRPLDAPINSAPLGFILPNSVADQDWILIDLIYPDRRGEILGLAANPDHQWIYQSKMKPDEVAYFNIYDSRGRPSIAHSALDMVEDPNVHTIRRSIESRTLVRY